MKKLIITLSIVIGLLLVSIATTFLIAVQSDNETAAEEAEAEIDEVIDRSWDTDELTTNLAGDHYVRASFQIQADARDTREELEKRDFQIKNAIIHRMSDMDAEELGSSEGLQTLEAELQEDINDLLDTGEVVEVYTTSRIIR